MTFIDSIRRQLQAMSATERQRAIGSLRDLIYEDAYTHALHPATDDGVACPRCGSLDVCVLASWRPLCERCFSAV